MKHRHLILTAILLSLFSSYSPSLVASEMAQNLQKLHYDPFTQPEILKAPQDASTDYYGNRAIRWQVELRATMRSSRGSRVIIDGNILAIGDEIEGYRLHEVYERSAVFIKDGKEYPVFMDEEANITDSY